MVDTVGRWFLVRFAHVAGAALWVGGPPALSLVILPPARRLLAPEAEDRFTAAAVRRFGMLTGTVFLPVQPATGWAMARHRGVTWESLAGPGNGRTLVAKLAPFAVVLLAAAGHGIAHSKGRTEAARTDGRRPGRLSGGRPARHRPAGHPTPHENRATWPAGWGRSTLLPERDHGAELTERRGHSARSRCEGAVP
ncbi:hypothetical protein ACWEQO_21370 [Streptomyces sp. NPDC004051]